MKLMVGCGVRCLWVGVMLGFLGSQSFRFKGGRSMYGACLRETEIE